VEVGSCRRGPSKLRWINVKCRVARVFKDQLRGCLINRRTVCRTPRWPWRGATRSTPLPTNALSGAL
jgi:hypothetical protein